MLKTLSYKSAPLISIVFLFLFFVSSQITHADTCTTPTVNASGGMVYVNSVCNQEIRHIVHLADTSNNLIGSYANIVWPAPGCGTNCSLNTTFAVNSPALASGTYKIIIYDQFATLINSATFSYAQDSCGTTTVGVSNGQIQISATCTSSTDHIVRITDVSGALIGPYEVTISHPAGCSPNCSVNTTFDGTSLPLPNGRYYVQIYDLGGNSLSNYYFDYVYSTPAPSSASGVKTVYAVKCTKDTETYISIFDMCVDYTKGIGLIISWIMVIGTLVAGLRIGISAIQFVTSSGDPGQLQEARESMTDAFLGLVLLVSAWIILAYLNATFAPQWHINLFQFSP